MSFTDVNEKDCREDITDDESKNVVTTLMSFLCIKYCLHITLDMKY